MSDDEKVEVSGDLRRETNAAYLIFDGSKEVWLPKSLVEWDGKLTFVVPRWMALKKGLC